MTWDSLTTRVEVETINDFKSKLDGQLKEINLSGYRDREGERD